MNVWIYGNAAKNGAKLFRLKPGDNWESGSTASFQTRGIMSRGGGGGTKKSRVLATSRYKVGPKSHSGGSSLQVITGHFICSNV